MKLTRLALVALLAPDAVGAKNKNYHNPTNVDEIKTRLVRGRSADEMIHDTGVLASNAAAAAGGGEHYTNAYDGMERRLSRDTCPNNDYVDCDDGFVRGNASQTCEEACGGKCCVGGSGTLQACHEFTGLVCKDEYSCIDRDNTLIGYGQSCRGANISKVVYGCHGRWSCRFAGSGGGTLKRVVDSCIGNQACQDCAANGGYIEEISGGSCIGYEVCADAAAEGGFIGKIVNGSCREGRESKACYQAAFHGFIGYIDRGCIGNTACRYAAACYNEEDDCTDASVRPNITYIVSSCVGEGSCEYLAAGGSNDPGNFVNGVYFGCNDVSACFKAAYADLGDITSGIFNCCNNRTECFEANQTSLPYQCGTSTPTSSPTTGNPTMSPTSGPTGNPVTASPSASPVTTSPSASPVTASPSASPVTASPSSSPVTDNPTPKPSSAPTAAPTKDEDEVASAAPTKDVLASAAPTADGKSGKAKGKASSKKSSKSSKSGTRAPTTKSNKATKAAKLFKSKSFKIVTESPSL